jgi:hypothetical protein
MKKPIFSILTIMLTMFFGSTLSAADNKLVVGQWDIVRSIQGQTVNIVLTITETADGLAGTWQGGQNTSALSDITFDGETLTFNRPGRQGGITSTTFKLAGDTLTGTLGGPDGPTEVTAKRKS